MSGQVHTAHARNRPFNVHITLRLPACNRISLLSVAGKILLIPIADIMINQAMDVAWIRGSF